MIKPEKDAGSGPAMVAARVHAFGGPDVIRYDRVPRPVPGPSEALIRVAASGFNRSDIGFRAGLLRNLVPLKLPFTLGAEVAGTVVELGENADGVEVGDSVIGRVDRGGTAAEYVAAPARRLVRAPSRIPLHEAAGIPVAGVTAWQALFEHAQVRNGTRILINGAGGGVGMFAVQLAHHEGAHVIATASSRSADRVRAYGAEQVIDYTTSSLAAVLDRPVDVALNLVPVRPETANVLCRLTREGGVLVSITVPIEPPEGSDVTASHFVARNDIAQLTDLVGLVDKGIVHVDITESRALTELHALHADAERGCVSGKVIVVP